VKKVFSLTHIADLETYITAIAGIFLFKASDFYPLFYYIVISWGILAFCEHMRSRHLLCG